MTPQAFRADLRAMFIEMRTRPWGAALWRLWDRDLAYKAPEGLSAMHTEPVGRMIVALPDADRAEALSILSKRFPAWAVVLRAASAA